jgi:hypothetical protein
LILFFLPNSSLIGDDPQRAGTIPNYVNVFQQGFVLESLSGYGFSSATYSPIFNIGSGNPASVTDFSQFSVGFSYQANTKIDPFALSDVTFQRVNSFIPQSAGMVYPFQSFRIGAGFSQKYSAELRIEDIPIRTIQYPEGTGEYTTSISKNSIYSMSALASYQFASLIANEDQLSLGIQTNMNLLRSRASIYNSTIKLSDQEINWKFGFRYAYHHQSVEKLQFGLTYEGKINFSGYYEYNPEPILPLGAVPNPAILTYPAKLNFGFLLESNSTFGIYNDFIYNFWEDMYPYNKNKLDLAGGVAVGANDGLLVSVGYYLFESYANNETESEIIGDTFFISGGLVLRYKLIDFHLVFADSHLYSPKGSRQTIGKLGVGLNL